MNKRLLISITSAAAMLAGLVLLMPAATAQSRSTKSAPVAGAWWFRGDAPQPGPPDITGVWQGRSTDDLSQDTMPGQEMILTPYGYERYKTVDHSKDPNTLCLPPGPARLVTRSHPTMIVQRPDVVVVLSESQYTFRLIYTDGRSHPEELQDYPEWNGSAVGKWEGDTLVVDTRGINDRTWIDTSGHEHSDQLHLTERFRLADPNLLEYIVTYTDPVFFVKPFSVRKTLRRVTAPDRIMSHSCNENEKDLEHLQPTIGGTGLDKAKVGTPNR